MRLLYALILASALGFSGVCQAGTPAPNGPSGDPAQNGLPPTLPGGRVIHTDELIQILKDVILIDVVEPTSFEPHKDIPGSVWISGVGAERLDDKQNDTFIQRLQSLTNDDPAQPLVFYGSTKDQGSLNAARRAIELGYRSVYWYAEGIEGWRGANQTLAAPKA